MQQHQLRPAKGARRNRKRVGRGDASGDGTYSGRGMKGQKARSGGGIRPGFEGGQLPLYLRLPAIRGFTNIFRREYSTVNVGKLDAFPENAKVTPKDLIDAGFVRNSKKPVKVLGEGTIKKPLTVEAHGFSKSATQKIEAAGGTVTKIQ